MGADSELYYKLQNAMNEYNDIDRQRKLIKNSMSGFQSPEEMSSDIRQQDIELELTKLNEKEKQLYNFLSPYLNKNKELIYPKNIQKGLDILEEQERLRKLKQKVIPSIDETTVPVTDPYIERIDKQIQRLESEKPLYGSEIERNLTPENIDAIYESGARGGK